jgi:predicted nucleotidyltransferase
MTSLEIKKKLYAIAPDIFGPSPVLFAYVYGSIAVDQAHPFSDLDVAAYVAPDLSEKAGLSLELSLSLEIDRQMGNGPPCEVRIMNWLPLAVAGEIVTHGILIYCRDDHARIDYETSIRSAYFDFLPSLRKFQKEYMESMNR